MTNPTDISADSSVTPSVVPTILTNPTETHLVSINATAQAPLKLTVTNYQSWHTQWYSLLIGYDFLKLVEVPLPIDLDKSSYQFRQDQLLRSALIASLSPDIVPYVVGEKTSYDVWNTLQKTYAKPSQARIMSLRESLFLTKKGTMSITEFLQKIKSITTTLAAAGVTVTMNETVLHVLHGLPAEYKEVSAAIRARDSAISFDDLHDKLTDFESQLNRDVGFPAAPTTVNYTAKNRVGSPTGNRFN